MQWYNFRPPGVTPNRRMGPHEALFVKLLWPLVFTSPPGQTGRRSHNVLDLSICLSVCYQTCEREILKMISMPIGTSRPQGNCMKKSTLIFRSSKLNVTPGRNRSRKCLSARYLKNYRTNFDGTWQVHIPTVSQQLVRRQGHSRSKVD